MATKRKGERQMKMLRFGTNVDLADEKKWRPQRQEQMKLLAFTLVVKTGHPPAQEHRGTRRTTTSAPSTSVPATARGSACPICLLGRYHC